MSLLFTNSLCNGEPWNSFCRCTNQNFQERPEYKQYNGGGTEKGLGAGNQCCNIVFASPDILSTLPAAEQPSSQIGSPSQYLDLFAKLNYVPCDYSKYMGGQTGNSRDTYIREQFEELYNYTEIQMNIFNNFFLYDPVAYPSTITKNSDLIPTTYENQIVCKDGMIPLILSYDDKYHNSSQYMLVCRPNGAPAPQMGFEYKLLYFYDVNKNPCKRNKCVTAYPPWDGYNFDNIGPGESTTKKNEDNWVNKKVIISPILGGILLIIFIIYIAFIIKDKTEEKNKKELIVNFRK